MHTPLLSVATTLTSAASALTIAELNGNTFLSPYNGQQVSNVSGFVTAKGPNGFFLRSLQPDNDNRTSESVYVYGTRTLSNVTVGDQISLDGSVYEYRSNKDYLYLNELEDAANIKTVSSNHSVIPLVLGKNGLHPPTEQYTYLDDGDVLGVPNNRSLLENVNPTLQPQTYGLDFWESLSGELVTITSPRAISKANNYGDTWVVGSWPTTGDNSRGALTLTAGDGNPEAIIIGSPLDGSSNPGDTKLGDSLADITGVVTYTFGFYSILPLTALTVIDSLSSAPPPTTLQSAHGCSGLTLGQYNVENLAPDSSLLPDIASQIANYLRTPDLMFLQEVQDNSGPTDDGVVSANVTLKTLTSAIAAASTSNSTTYGNKTVAYEYATVDPIDGTNGGQPGGNIRNAYLYNPSVLRLVDPSTGSPNATARLTANNTLTPNPAVLDPGNEAWEASRKPLIALFETVYAPHTKIWAVNVHFSSKGGSTNFQSDPRPPVNGVIEKRIMQANVTASFIAGILAADPDAVVVAAGDFNEFAFAAPMIGFEEISGLTEMDVVVGLPEVERYTYVFDMNAQQLDHMYVSPKAAERAEFEHVHISSWVSAGDEISDHDPSVGRLDVC